MRVTVVFTLLLGMVFSTSGANDLYSSTSSEDYIPIVGSVEVYDSITGVMNVSDFPVKLHGATRYTDLKGRLRSKQAIKIGAQLKVEIEGEEMLRESPPYRAMVVIFLE